MPQLFDNLLVSSPNGGGLLFIHRDQAFLLDNVNTTGISLSGTTLLRGLQPQGLVLYKDHRAEQHDVPHIHDIHDVLIAEPFLYTVGTTANEILQLNEDAEEIRRWTLEGEKDAKHLNCLALWNQRIVFCAFGDFTEHRQYKGQTEQTGFVQDLHSGERLITGLSQPHSLFALGEHLLLANSETKELREYDSHGLLLRSKTLDGYTRGLCVHNGKIYIGLSRSRNIGDDPLSSARLVALDSQSWQELGHIDLPVSEVYSIHGIKNPDVIPALLAGISQHASARYQQSIEERDTQLQKLVEHSARLELLNTSFEEQLHQQNKQHHDTLSHSLQVQAQQLMQLTDEKSTHESLRQECIAQEQRHAQLIEQLTLAQHAKNQQLDSTVALLADRNTELAAMSLRFEASQHQYQQTLDKLETALALLTERDSDLAVLSQRHETTHQQYQQTLDKLDTALALLTARDSDLAVLSQRHETTHQQYQQTLDKLGTTLALLTARDSDLAALSQHHEATHQQYQQTLDKLDTALALLTERDADLAALSQRYEEIHSQQQQILNSNSWFLTQPIRNLRRWSKL